MNDESQGELMPRHPGGRPVGYPKTGGRVKGTVNRTPSVAVALANRHSPDAVRYLVKIMRGQRFAQGRKWLYPSVHSRTLAASKLLDVAEMPERKSFGGTPLVVNIQL